MYDDGTYLAQNPTWHTENSGWKAAQIRRILERNHVEPRDVGEIGCGAGEVLRNLHLSYPDVPATGYEISPQGFSLCSALSGPRLRFRLVDLTETSERHHVLLVIDVAEHVEDYLGFLRRIKGHAEYFVFHIPLDLTVQSLMRATPLESARRTVGHLHYFTRESALASLKHCGYSIVDEAYTYLQLESPNRSLKVRLVAPIRRLALALNEHLAVRFLGGCSLMVLARG